MAENNASTREFVSDYVVQFGKLLASSFMALIWRDQFSLFTNKQNTVIKLLITNASSMLWATRCSRGLPAGLHLVSLCCVSEARHLTLTMPLSAQEYKLKPKNSRWTGVQQEYQQSYYSFHASDNGITYTRIGFTSQLDFKPLFKFTCRINTWFIVFRKEGLGLFSPLALLFGLRQSNLAAI